MDRPRRAKGLSTGVGGAARVGFGLACWIPHWRKVSGVARLRSQLKRFNHVSPFAYRARPDGTLKDPMRMAHAPWPGLRAQARTLGVGVLPTVVFGREGRAAVLTDGKRRGLHVEALVNLVQQQGFDGLDLDYERKSAPEARGFEALVVELARRLHALGLQLSCTIEARTAAATPASAAGRDLEDYRLLARACDHIRVMAYDYHRSGQPDARARVAHAPLPWVKRVVEYALTEIPASKLWLGVPTYGWGFVRVGRVYQRERAWGFRPLRARLAGRALVHGAGGEAHVQLGEQEIVVADAEAIRARIELARDAGLAGAVLFKLDGEEDPALWPALDALGLKGP